MGATFDCTAAAQADVKRFLIIDPAINGGKRGLVSHVEIPPPWDDESLNPAESPHAVLLMTVEAKVPEDGSCAQVLLRYEDGLYWFSPVKNYVEIMGIFTSDPVFEPFAIDVCPRVHGGLQLPGDANQDANLDLSDAIWLLGHLFLGTAPKLPCEGGTASAPGPGELSLVDFNGDGAIDLSDAVSTLSFLFLGGRPPALGTECVPVGGCPDTCE